MKLLEKMQRCINALSVYGLKIDDIDKFINTRKKIILYSIIDLNRCIEIGLYKPKSKLVREIEDKIIEWCMS